MTNEEKIEKMLKFFHGSRTLKDLLLEMAEWKDNEFMTALTETDIKNFPSHYEFVEYIRKRLNIEALCQTENL